MEKIFEYIENSTDLIIDLQKGLTSCPAINPENGGDGEYKKFLFLKNYISKWGFSSISEIFIRDNRVSSKIRPSLIVSLYGKNKNKKLWIITHLDVVPEGEISLWHTNPFEAVVKEGKIYGRGTEDNQQSLVSSLIALKSLIDNNIIPKYDVNLMFVSDEEVGSEYGIKWILDNTNIFNENDLIITPDVGDPQGNSIEIAEKSILWVCFKIIGKQSHGSRPDLGINAARASSHLCLKIDEFNNIYNLKDHLFDINRSTFEPTKRIGSVTNINTIPGEETLCFDCRILPDYNLNDIINHINIIKTDIEKQFNVKIDVSFPQKLQAAPKTDENSEVIQLLKKSIKKITNKEPKLIGIGGGTVAAYFRMKGFNAALWSTVDNTMHSPNEYSVIKNTINDAKVFADLMIGEE